MLPEKERRLIRIELPCMKESTGTQVTLVSTAGVDARLGYLELCYRRQLKMRDAFCTFVIRKLRPVIL